MSVAMLPCCCCASCNSGSYQQTEATSRTGRASKNQYTWGAYEKDWAASGQLYQRPSYPDGRPFDPEDVMRPLRLNGIVGKGPNCD
jgi:hypothetical protein